MIIKKHYPYDQTEPSLGKTWTIILLPNLASRYFIIFLITVLKDHPVKFFLLFRNLLRLILIKLTFLFPFLFVTHTQTSLATSSNANFTSQKVDPWVGHVILCRICKCEKSYIERFNEIDEHSITLYINHTI